MSRRDSGPAVEIPSKQAAKDIATKLKAGEFYRQNGDLAVDKLSSRDTYNYSTSRKTQNLIIDHLEAMGVVKKQEGKKPALITPEYQYQTVDDEVVSGLKGLGFKTAEAKQKAARAAGKTTEDKIKSALRQHTAAA